MEQAKDKKRLLSAITALLVLVAVLFLALVGVCLYCHIKGI
jgi:flagellar basal body-associated protein FliL